MSQYWPNFVEKSPARGPAPIQTKRFTYVLQSGDVSGGAINFTFPISFDAPFPDSNYTVSVLLDTTPDSNPSHQNPRVFTNYALLQRQPGFVNLNLVGSGFSVGDAITMHVVALHD